MSPSRLSPPLAAALDPAITHNNRDGGVSDYRLTQGFWRPSHTSFTSRSFS